MKKTKVFGYMMTGALSIGILGAGISAYAATDNTSTTKDTATQQKADAIIQEAKEKLAKLGVTLPARGERPDMFANLDEATKAKAKNIMDQLKAGKLTETEAKTQLAKLGVTLPARGERPDMFANLDEATKAKAEKYHGTAES